MLWKRAAGQKRQKRQKLFSDRELLNRVRRLPRDEDGAALFLTALAMVVLLGFAALVTDVAILYLNRISLSNAVDAAALAGVQELPTSAWAAERRALEYGERNGVPVGMTVWVSPNREQITVEAKRVVDFFFARVLGLTETEVSARATARVGSVRAYGGAVPLAVVEQEFEYGKQYLLKVGPQTNPGPYRGNFGALALGGNGASNYEKNLREGYRGMLRIGDRVPTEPGNMAGPTARAVRYRIDHDLLTPGCTSFETSHSGCLRRVVVPVIAGYTQGGRHEVEIVGFAAFYIEGTTRDGGDDFVVGRFLEMAVDGEVGDGRSYGLRAYRLVD